jgi:phosphoenolpyruvate-protein kinase (PTS system EI component)
MAESARVLRRVQRLIWFGLTSTAVVAGTVVLCGPDVPGQAQEELALLVIVASSWAVVHQVARHTRGEQARMHASTEAARREAVRFLSHLAKDRVKNKLAITAGYTEIVADDPRLPEDLRTQVLKAVEGAFAAARAIDQLADAQLPASEADAVEEPPSAAPTVAKGRR